MSYASHIFNHAHRPYARNLVRYLQVNARAYGAPQRDMERGAFVATDGTFYSTRIPAPVALASLINTGRDRAGRRMIVDALRRVRLAA